jgi:hypothetical protein
MHVTERVRRWSLLAAVLALALAALAPAGCGGGGGAADSQGGPPPGNGTPATAGQALSTDIPPGRSMAEGGGGPASYTFREEWRRALVEAQKWRGGAYLITAAGDMVNDDGVPNHWTLSFIDKADADAVLVLEIDPWGKVTSTREVTKTGQGTRSFIGKYTKRIPYDVIDSDKAVGIAKASLASRYDLSKTTDPRIGLDYSLTDGSGPYWNYILRDTSAREYITAQVNALTGAVTPPK